ncbi:UbiA family prenyltransferase [Micromonospora tarensis]|uniref:UbiA prenyltransferase family protein n=1 Tax=Micromonospora tarensis TaxID=2806100 RepID=A0ABS1YNF5_9ACTN|nr:UbiA prenyltransferase family protein [Micromonospora tarensis]MBM0278973.1 UbiA prenyltransferase family protein [Micromonospora tarensis]
MNRWRAEGQRLAEATRMSLVGVVLAALLLGAFSAEGHVPPAAGLGGLLVVGTLLHLAVYLLNDVADRHIDRTDPRRSSFPMVTGALPMAVATAVAVAALTLSVALDLLLFRVEPGRMATLYIAAAALVGYDFTGKRCRWPVLTDLLQGLGGAAVVSYGATVAGGPTFATWLTAAYATIYLMLVNGIHGGIRDVENDRRHGARTLAVLTGARGAPAEVSIPRVLRRYAMSLQTVLVLLATMPLLRLARSGAPFGTRLLPAVLAPVVALAAAVVLARALRPGLPAGTRQHLGAAQLVLGYLPAVAMAGSGRGVGLVLLGMAVMAAPLLANPWYRRGLLVATGLHHCRPDPTAER